jgi:hypothetical protein
MINGRWSGHRSDIQEHADVGLEDGTKGIEEPTMRVDLLLVLLFEAENDLNGDDAFLCTFNLQMGVDRD